ncbi:MAG: DUF4367 domain-containing protein [Peptococcaceae bacterium]|nr:DUF4367 domain-containing protein [Peptococcaceae bacterium]
MRDNLVSEEKLQEAAREYLLWELQKFDAYADYPEPEFHGSYKLQMAALRHDVKRGAIKEAEYRMGVTFYIKRSIAAILLVFTMACLTMPETVLAGYQKLIEVIETVFDEYTEYRYRVNDVGAIEEEFRPLKLGYLPEGMEEVKRRERENSLDLLYRDKEEKYITLYQCFVVEERSLVFGADTEEVEKQIYYMQDEIVRLNIEKDKIKFVWNHEHYYITGQTNLAEKELIELLENVKI